MNLPLFIAARYLFAKKSHNVINIISAISAIGMAVGTAALILILSVYNGFDSIIRDNLSDLDPDIRAVASEGKFFIPDGPLWDSLRQDERIESISEVLEDNVFLNYGGQQGIARAKGVGDKFGEASGIGRHCVEGQFSLHHSEVPLCSVGASLAYRMGIRAHFTSPLELYYPDPKSNISLVDPTSSLRSVKLWPKSLFSISADIDNELIIVPIESMRRITGLSYGELSSLEIRLKDGSEKNVRSFIKDYRGLEQAGFVLQDRFAQHPSLFKMMRYEKLAIYLILIFVVIIIAFNVFGSLSMLVIEKSGDMQTFRSMGASENCIRKIFFYEGWMISLSGLLVGLVAGIGLALLQQITGLVKMPGNYLVNSYPVVLQASDVLFTALGVAVAGLEIAFIGSRSALAQVGRGSSQ